MQFKKCSRCGSFFMTDSDVCPNCKPKDIYDMNKLKNFLENCDTNISTEQISFSTGISEKNLHRFFSCTEFSNFNLKNDINQPNINL